MLPNLVESQPAAAEIDLTVKLTDVVLAAANAARTVKQPGPEGVDAAAGAPLWVTPISMWTPHTHPPRH
jgi:hypothetical protein